MGYLSGKTFKVCKTENILILLFYVKNSLGEYRNLGLKSFLHTNLKSLFLCLLVYSAVDKKYNIGQIFIPSFFILHSLFFLQSPHSGILKSIFILTVLKFQQIMSSYASPSIHSILGSYFQLEDSCLSKPQGNFLFLLLLVFWLLLLPPFHCSETLIR